MVGSEQYLATLSAAALSLLKVTMYWGKSVIVAFTRRNRQWISFTFTSSDGQFLIN